MAKKRLMKQLFFLGLIALTASSLTAQEPKKLSLRSGVNNYAGVVDTYIDQFNITNSFNAEKKLEIRNYSQKDTLTENCQALIKFDLSQIPSNATIVSATLNLFSIRGKAAASSTPSINKITVAWAETIKWPDGVPPSAPVNGVTFSDLTKLSSKPAAPELVTVSGLKDLVQSWVTDPASNFGMAIIGGPKLNLRVTSSEYKPVEQRPELVIEYTSEGGAAAPTPTPTPDAGASTNTPPATGETKPEEKK
jgi:hypothetical protein